MHFRAATGWIGIGVTTGWMALAGVPAGAADDPVTFSEHVAPILFENCTSCHRPGEAAPFSLLDYRDARTRGRLVASVTESRRMPPWKAGPGDYPFKNERHLTDAQIQTIRRWVDGGMVEGDRRRLPTLPVFTEGWQIGEPDLVVTMKDAFTVPADGPDVYRNFVVPLNLSEDRWVRAVDFRPSARTVVHHSLFFLDATGAARQQDEADPLPGYSGAMGAGAVGGGRGRLAAALGRGGRGRSSGRGADPAAEVEGLGRSGGSLGGWALGGRARELPSGLAFFVPKGSDLILSTHFHPSGKVEREQSTVGIYFADRPPTQAFTAIQLPPLFGVFEGIDIPAGEAQYTIADAFVLPVDVKAFGVGAHAHYLGKEMKLTATLPDGAVRTLLWIRDWDFAWQEQYQFRDFVTLPKGTRLDVTIRYDNSEGNPRNPSHPPARVTWGEESNDEMGSMSLQVVAAHAGELPRLQQAYAEHLRQALFSRPGLMRLLQQGRGATGRGRP
jgi:hypothetical protein